MAEITCAACVRKVEKLKGLLGVEEAAVNLSTGKPGPVFEPAVCTLPEIEKAIEECSYDVPWSRIRLLVNPGA